MVDLDKDKLRLERQRLAIETRLRRRDQEFQRMQFEATRTGVAAWAQVITPVGAAIVAGIVGLFGTVWNGYQSNKIETIKQEADERLERQKRESTLILEAIKTGGEGEEKEQQTAANLVFLVDAGLLDLQPDKLDTLRGKAGDALPSLPQPTSGGRSPFDIPVTPRQREKSGVQSVVIHSTESPPGMSITRLEEMLRRRALAHYLIAVDGRVIKVLDESAVALHVGPASAPQFSNSNAIGIELAGFARDGFTVEQVSALQNVLVDIVKRHNISVDNIVGHKDVAAPPGRRVDPGDKLDLVKLRAAVTAHLGN